MSRPSTIAVLGLFARTALRRMANRMEMLKYTRRRKAAGAEPAREATVHRSARESRGASCLVKLFGLMLLLGSAMFSYIAPHTLIDAVWLTEWEATSPRPIPAKVYAELQAASQVANPALRQEQLDEAIAAFSDN